LRWFAVVCGERGFAPSSALGAHRVEEEGGRRRWWRRRRKKRRRNFMYDFGFAAGLHSKRGLGLSSPYIHIYIVPWNSYAVPWCNARLQ